MFSLNNTNGIVSPQWTGLRGQSALDCNADNSNTSAGTIQVDFYQPQLQSVPADETSAIKDFLRLRQLPQRLDL